MPGLSAAVSEGFKANILPYLPVISEPAVDRENFRVQELLVTGRSVSVFVLGYFSAIGLACFSSSKPLLPLRFLSLIVGATAGLWFYEWRRAGDRLDELAVDHFRKEIIVREKATNHIRTSPRAFSMILSLPPEERKVCLNRQSDNSLNRRTLREEILSLGWLGGEQVQKMYIDSLESLEENPFQLDENGKSVFSLLEDGTRAPSLQFYLQSKKFAPPEDLREQAKIWKQVKYSSTIDLLCQRGFDINAQDEKEWTPLMHWAEQGERHFVVAAANAGADLRCRASALVPGEKGILKAMLEDAESKIGLQPITSLPKDESLFRWFPWKAAVLKGEYRFETDNRRDFIHAKIACFVATIWLYVSVSFSSTILRGSPLLFSAWHVIGKGLMTAMAVSVLVGIADLWRANQQAKREAVIDYLTKVYPSHQATYTISHDLKAAQILIQSARDNGLPVAAILDKPSEKGGSLLGQIGISFEVFKLLIDEGADPRKEINPNANSASLPDFSGETTSGLLRAIENPDPRFIQYLFDHEHLDNMPDELKIKLWTSVSSKEKADVLSGQHLRPDGVRDEKGNTPLMLVVQGAHPSLDKAEILLMAGADPTLINNEGKTAIDLITVESNRALFIELCKAHSPSYREKVS